MSSSSLSLPKHKQYQIYQQIIAKFLLNLPLQQRKDQSRLSFHAQKAWYHYIDVVLAQHQSQKQKQSLDQNSSQLRHNFFQKLRLYSPKSLNINPALIIKKLQQNKPTCGAIIFNENSTKVLVIKNKEDRLGFPKGKWNEHEKQQECAAREVYEQIGIYLHKRIDPSQKVEFINSGGVNSTFFVVRGIKQNEKLSIDKKQINEVFWMKVDDVTKYQKRFVKSARIAWKYYLEQYDEKMTIEEFIQYYKPTNSQKAINDARQKQKQKAVPPHRNQSVLDSPNLNKQAQQNGNSLKFYPLSSNVIQEEENPFLTFKLDKQKLMKVFLINF